MIHGRGSHIHSGIVLKFRIFEWPLVAFSKSSTIGSMREKSQLVVPPEGASSSATASRGYGNQGANRTKSACSALSSAKTLSWIGESGRISGFTTTCSVGVVCETRATLFQFTDNVSGGFT